MNRKTRNRFAIALAAASLASCVTGCASLGQAVAGAKAANDQVIEANKVALCAIPVSALARHPELLPAIKSLCLAADDTAAAAAALDAIKK